MVGPALMIILSGSCALNSMGSEGGGSITIIGQNFLSWPTHSLDQILFIYYLLVAVIKIRKLCRVKVKLFYSKL